MLSHTFLFPSQVRGTVFLNLRKARQYGMPASPTHTHYRYLGP